ncbi:hypothetical protein Amal_03325 [Acetobacter malorum]|uniref:Uncharacterized protein n=1 Tax=Acetobacter malorum TaxID=178901 RepID=A0A177G7F6_9PROT|nr:hypothetical protein Amal_03325 [Acetobacter malorum]
MHSGGRKLHQLMVIADCPLRSLANGGLYVRDEAEAAAAHLALRKCGRSLAPSVEGRITPGECGFVSGSHLACLSIRCAV